uniref:Uncharacterized protein n=1 Tax=Oryza rufipogon TaxID=4529 RepID=A0A679BE02_ORYRU|nr:hypothetical protein [Oryza rufipogon]
MHCSTATHPSPASAGSPARPPHRSTKKMVKPACTLMAREAENGIHDPMKDVKTKINCALLGCSFIRQKDLTTVD